MVSRSKDRLYPRGLLGSEDYASERPSYRAVPFSFFLLFAAAGELTLTSSTAHVGKRTPSVTVALQVVAALYRSPLTLTGPN